MRLNPAGLPLSSAYRLENRGLLKSEWKTTDGGREVKYYSLTKTDAGD